MHSRKINQFCFVVFVLVYSLLWCVSVTRGKAIDVRKKYTTPKPALTKPPIPAKWNTVRILNKMCNLYSHEARNYTQYRPTTRGINDTFIIVRKKIGRGVDTSIAEFPHMAAIGYGQLNSIKWECSGTLVSDSFVLSAAHCYNDSIHGLATWVRLGDTDLNHSLDDEYVQQIRIKTIYPHFRYKPPDNYNDIVLFELSTCVKFNVFVRPICLTTSAENFKIGSIGIITGYGYKTDLFENSDIAESEIRGHLRGGDIKCHDQTKCNHIYKDRENGFSLGFNSSLFICAGDMIDGNDTCHGDSGGPLQIKHPKFPRMHIQVGVTSRGPIGCRRPTFPAVYTRVFPYIEWIQRIVWPNNLFRY